MAGVKGKKTFFKEDFLESKQFTIQEKDVLAALLQENQTYSLEEAKKAISDFRKVVQ